MQFKSFILVFFISSLVFSQDKPERIWSIGVIYTNAESNRLKDRWPNDTTIVFTDTANNAYREYIYTEKPIRVNNFGFEVTRRINSKFSIGTGINFKSFGLEYSKTTNRYYNNQLNKRWINAGRSGYGYVGIPLTFSYSFVNSKIINLYTKAHIEIMMMKWNKGWRYTYIPDPYNHAQGYDDFFYTYSRKIKPKEEHRINGTVGGAMGLQLNLSKSIYITLQAFTDFQLRTLYTDSDVYYFRYGLNSSLNYNFKRRNRSYTV
jgi:hypothetical protein